MQPPLSLSTLGLGLVFLTGHLFSPIPRLAFRACWSRVGAWSPDATRSAGPPRRDLKSSVLAGSCPPRALPKTSLGRSAHTNAPHDGCTPVEGDYTYADDTQAHGQPHKTERNHAQLGGDAALLQSYVLTRSSNQGSVSNVRLLLEDLC